jgi:hypothetical protein
MRFAPHTATGRPVIRADSIASIVTAWSRRSAIDVTQIGKAFLTISVPRSALH